MLVALPPLFFSFVAIAFILSFSYPPAQMRREAELREAEERVREVEQAAKTERDEAARALSEADAHKQALAKLEEVWFN